MVHLSDLVDNGNYFTLSKSSIKLNRAKLIVNKQVDYEFVQEHSIVVYSSIITNIGDKTAIDTVFKDEINFGSSFVEYSLYLDFNQLVGVNPKTGINIGDLRPGESRAISFEVNIVDFEKCRNALTRSSVNYKYNLSDNICNQVVDEEFSNFIKLELDNFFQCNNDYEESNRCKLNADIDVEMFVSDRFATLNDILEYTINISNNSDVNFYDVIISDVLSDKVEFVKGSMKIGGSEVLLENIENGVNVGDFPIGKMKLISFKAKVIKNEVSIIENRCVANYNYKICVDGNKQHKVMQSNIVNVILEKNKVVVCKKADKKTARILDIIRYRVEINNEGSVVTSNMVLLDEFSDNLELVKGSVFINGFNAPINSLKGGIRIGLLKPKETYVINYSMKVIGGAYNKKSENCAYVSYDYKLSCGKVGSSVSNKFCSCLNVLSESFTQTIINTEYLVKDKCRKVKEIDNINADIIVNDSYIIGTLKGISEEGHVMSGRNIVVHGTAWVSLEYTTYENTIHSESFKCLFSENIVIPSDYVNSDKNEIVAIVEDIESTVMEKNKILIDVIVMLTMKNV